MPQAEIGGGQAPPFNPEQFAGVVTEGSQYDDPDAPKPLVDPAEFAQEERAERNAYWLLAAFLFSFIGSLVEYAVWGRLDVAFLIGTFAFLVAAGVWWGRSEGPPEPRDPF